MSLQERGMAEQKEETVIHIDIPAAHQYLNVLGAAIQALLERVGGLDERARLVYSVELAVHETCVNIVQHAYRDHPGRIQVSLSLTGEPQRLVVDVLDHGRSFDFSQVTAPDLDQVQTHGYGLFLVGELMDEISYQPDANGNHWRLVKTMA